MIVSWKLNLEIDLILNQFHPMITADLEFEEHDGQIVVSHQFQEKQFICSPHHTLRLYLTNLNMSKIIYIIYKHFALIY